MRTQGAIGKVKSANITRTRINGMLNEAKLNALFDSVTDDSLEQVVKLWYTSNTSSKEDRSSMDRLLPEEFKVALKEKFDIDIMIDGARVTIGKVIFSRMMKYITQHPERLTLGIYDTLLEHKDFHHIVSLVQKKTDAKGNMMLIPTNTGLTQSKAIDAEGMINLQNIALAKLKMLMQYVTKEKAKEANIGGITKAMRDLMATLHMMRLDFAPDAVMEATFKETTASDDGKTVKEKVTRYVQKSAQTWNQK